MRVRFLAVLGAVGVLCGSVLSAGQITSYVDEQGRRVFINADPPPKATPAKKTRRRVRLVRDSETGNWRAIPIREVKMPLAPEPATAQQPSPQAATAANEAQPAAPPGASPAVESALVVPDGDVDAVIDQASQENGIDPNLVRAIIRAESNYNPNAVSPKGALGLMQLMPSTARSMGVQDVFDPAQNVVGGVRYLKQLLEEFPGQLHLSIAAYNAGPGAVERHGGIPPYRETRDYVQRVSHFYRSGSFANPFQSFGPAASKPAKPADRWGIIKRVDERGRVHFSNTEGW